MQKWMLMVGLTTMATSVACEVAVDDSAERVEPTFVTGEDVASLHVGQRLILDVRDHQAVFDFDQTGARVDFSRVAIITRGEGTVTLSDWLRKAHGELDTNLVQLDRFTLTGGIQQAPSQGVVGGCNQRCRVVRGVTVCDWRCQLTEEQLTRDAYDDSRNMDRGEDLPTDPVNPGGPQPDPSPEDPTNPSNSNPTGNPNPGSGGSSSSGGGSGSSGGGHSAGGGSPGGGASSPGSGGGW